MCRCTFLLSFLILTLTPLQSQIKYQNPDPQPNPLHSSFFLNQDFGWVGGSLGTIMLTTDGGNSWEYTKLENETIRDIYFINETTGFIACGGNIFSSSNGAIYKTTDGGHSWNSKIMFPWSYTGATFPLTMFHKIYFIDNNIGWASGTSYLDINNDRAGILYKTTDGGETWNLLVSFNYGDINYYETIFDFVFESESIGYIIASDTLTPPSSIFKTTDGGVSWNRFIDQQSEYSNWWFDVVEKHNQFIFTSNRKGIFRQNTDGSDLSLIWSAEDNAYLFDEFEPIIIDIIFVNDIAMVIGYYGDFVSVIPFTMTSTNYFSTFNVTIHHEFANRAEGILPTPIPFTSVNSYDGERWWLTTDCGYGFSLIYAYGNNLILSDDDCSSLHYTTTSRCDYNLNDIKFSTSNIGIICADDGKILRSPDGGFNWTEVESPTTKDLITIDLSNENKYWISGKDGVLLFSTDQGITWNIISIDIQNYIYSLSFIDSNIGWAAGGYPGHDGDPTQYAAIYKTTDAGITWDQQFNETGKYFNSVYFLNANEGWATGSKRYVYHTTDGGDTWVEPEYFWNRPGYELLGNFFKIVFIDNINGYLFLSYGERFYIYTTQDGGVNWSYIEFLLPNEDWPVYVSDICDVILSDDNMYLLGEGSFISPENGIILSSSDQGTSWDVLTRNFLYYSKGTYHNGSLWAVGDKGLLVNQINTQSVLTDVEPNIFSNIQNDFSLSNNYPNPFNPNTTIQFSIPKSDNVTLKVYDILGREITTLINEYKHSGTYVTKFNATNLASGIYFYTLNSGSTFITKKMLLIK